MTASGYHRRTNLTYRDYDEVMPRLCRHQDTVYARQDVVILVGKPQYLAEDFAKQRGNAHGGLGTKREFLARRT